MSNPVRRTPCFCQVLTIVFSVCCALNAAAAERFASHSSLGSRVPVTRAVGSTRSITQGRGEAVFILPDLDESPETWQSLLADLGERFAATAIGWTAGDLADPRGIMTTLQSGNGESVHLIGEGAGARLALRLAIEYPDQVRSLVLSAPDPRWFARDAAVEAARHGASLPSEVDTLLSAFRLGRITVPVLVLGGDRDSRWAADNTLHGWMRAAREQTLRGAGSQPHIHASIDFNRAVARFLERQRLTAGAP